MRAGDINSAKEFKNKAGSVKYTKKEQRSTVRKVREDE